MSFNILHYNSGDLTKPQEWKDLKAKRLRVDEIIIDGVDLPYTVEVGPTLSAYDDLGNLLVTTNPITTRYQRLGEIINIGIRDIEIAAFPAGSTSYIRLEGLDFPAAFPVSGVYACSGNSDTVVPSGVQPEFIFAGSLAEAANNFYIRPTDQGRVWTPTFTSAPLIITHFY